MLTSCPTIAAPWTRIWSSSVESLRCPLPTFSTRPLLTLVLPFLMRKNDSISADLSARYRRPWQLDNGLIIAMDYGVTGQLCFGSGFPVSRPAVGYASFPRRLIGHDLETTAIETDFRHLANSRK